MSTDRLLLTIEETAEVLNLGKDTVYQLVHRSDFPCIKFNRGWRISRAGLEKWIADEVEKAQAEREIWKGREIS